MAKFASRCVATLYVVVVDVQTTMRLVQLLQHALPVVRCQQLSVGHYKIRIMYMC